MPYQERTHHSSASEFLRYALDSIPSCPHLSVDSFEDIHKRSANRPNQLSQPTVLPFIARLRAAFNASSRDSSVRLHDAIQACSKVAALRYLHAHRPARSDLCSLLADGLLSVARSGVVPSQVLASSLTPVFPNGVAPDNALLALEVLSGSIRDLTHFADPLLGHALATSHVNLFSAIRRLDDDVLQDVIAPSILPLLSVAASTVFSPGTSVVAPQIAPHVPSLETSSACRSIQITTKYAPSLTTSIVISAATQTSVRLDRDTFNSFASLFLLASRNPARTLNVFRFHAVPLQGKHPVHIAGRAIRLEPHLVRALQQTMNDHLSHPTQVAWSNYRAAQMGDF